MQSASAWNVIQCCINCIESIDPPPPRLVIAARTTDKLLATQQECLKFTADVFAVTADVSKEEDCKAIIDAAVREFGGVDVLILNAAITPEPRWFTELQDPVRRGAPVVSCVLMHV